MEGRLTARINGSLAARGWVMGALTLGLFVAAPATAQEAASAYPPELLQPHLVAIDGGRRLNIFCTGRGGPTVVFEQGFGSNALHWMGVLPAISRLTRTCVYDRAGYGLSDAPSGASDATNATSNLHALLRADHISTPVILVGHSLGGLYATLYADRFPKEVAGLVLVDPSFAGMKGITAETPEEAGLMKKRDDDEIAHDVSCAALAREGALTDSDMKGCMPPTRPGRSPEEITYLRQPYKRAGYFGTLLSEGDSVGREGVADPADFRQERQAARSWESVPVIVLSRGAQGAPPPNIAEARWKAADAEWLAGHERLAARSTRGRHIIVPGAGHAIQIDKPEAVIRAVKEILQEVRRR